MNNPLPSGRDLPEINHAYIQDEIQQPRIQGDMIEHSFMDLSQLYSPAFI